MNSVPIHIPISMRMSVSLYPEYDVIRSDGRSRRQLLTAMALITFPATLSYLKKNAYVCFVRNLLKTYLS